MTNEQKYKTIQERHRAIGEYCKLQHNCRDCACRSDKNHGWVCVFSWLALEAEKEEKPLPCPFCGGEAHVIDFTNPFVQCSKCGISTNNYSYRYEAVAAWNRRVK